MKKNKLTDIKLKSVDLVNRGANQDADIVFYKSDNPPEETEKSTLKKAFDYLKQLFSEEDNSVTKSDIVKEYDGYAAQLCASFDTVFEKDGMNAEEKTAIMQKSITEFADFMSMAAPIWASGCSVAKSDKLTDIIAKAETPGNSEGEKGKENENMDLSKLTPEEQETFKSLQAKINGGAEPPKKEEKDPVVEPPKPDVTKSEDVNKSDIPEFVKVALKKSEEFIEAQGLKDMKEVAKKYEVLGEKADELGQHLYELKKSDNALYDASIALLDRQVEAIEKSGIFTEIGKSGAHGGETDVVKKAEGMAAEIRKSAPGLTYEQALAQVWESNPEMMNEYMQNM